MMQLRPPVVTILGHVDHGKTSILDRIRKSNVAAKEPGQITQSIGAYQISWKKKVFTFLDTPGHEAFSQMRSRGVKVADVAVLVVAANDGVMPQTKESIKIIDQAKIPFIVALNKIDLPGVVLDKVKGQLAENEVLVEGYGGKVVAIPVSAKTGEGIDSLLEMIALTAEIEELKADPEGSFGAVVIESKIDRAQGPLATVLVQNGAFRVGDSLVCEGIYGKVRSMRSDTGESLKVSQISQPIEVVGFKDPLPVGAKVSKSIPGEEIISSGPREKRPVDDQSTEEKKVKVVLRADSTGSLEAILGILPSEVEILQAEVGNICESDILLAKTFSARIFGFNIKTPASVLKLAETEKVKVKNYNIIYDLLKEVEGVILKTMEPTIDRDVLGKAGIIAEFSMKGEKIAGAKVLSGRINKGDKICLERDSQILAEVGIKSMRHAKQEINQAEQGMEFGIIFSAPVNFQKDDLIVAWQ